MSNSSLSVEIDVEGVIQALSGTKKSLKSIRKQTVGIIAKGVKKTITSAIRSSGLNKRTGELFQAYRYKVKKDGSEANVFPKALNSNSTIYPKAMTLSYGHNGPTERAAQWHIKALGFVDSGRQYIESGNYQRDIDNMVEKQLQKYWG